MRKKWILIGAILAALVISSGVFAFTYTTATTTIDAYAIESDFAKVEAVGEVDIGDVFGKLRGDLPTEETLFEITPHEDYTGDLLVKVYLANAGALSLAYQHFNMKLMLEGSVEEEEDVEYELLTLDNAEVTFNLEGNSDECDLMLLGGSYCTNPTDPLEWEEGYEVAPQLFCEATQR